MARLIENQMADKLSALLAREAGRLTATVPPPPVVSPVPNWQHVRVMSAGIQTVASSDSDSDTLDMPLTYYAGRIEIWNARDRAQMQYMDVWVLDINEDELATGRFYLCRQSGNVRLHIACAAADAASDSDSDSDSEMGCSDGLSDGAETRPLFVHGDGSACGNEIEVEILLDACFIQGVPPA